MYSKLGVIAQSIIDLHGIARHIEELGVTNTHAKQIREIADSLNEWHKASLIQRNELLKYKDDLK